MSSKNDILQSERELIEKLKSSFPSLVINYGELQNAIIPSNFSSNNPLTKSRREMLMNTLVDKLIEAKEYIGNPNDLNEAVYLLTNLRINQENGWSWDLTTELGSNPKDKTVEIPKVNINDGENNYSIRLNFDYKKDNPHSDDEDEIIHFNIKNIEVEKNGEKVNIEKIDDGLIKRFLLTLNEGSIGNTVSYLKGDKADRDKVLSDSLMHKFKEITSVFFLRSETLDGFSIPKRDFLDKSSKQDVNELPNNELPNNGKSQLKLF